jgi:hypothetical protein
LPIEVNVSVRHGRLLLNEAFLTQKDVFDVRIKVRNYAGFSQPPGPNTYGLYHVPLSGSTDCALCIRGWEWIDGKLVCCDTNPCRSCKQWGTGDKFVSIRGTLEDVNLALSNLTYVNDLHFNTRYGLTEAVLIEVSDEGALGNDFGNDPPLRTLWEIALDVESVNDAPVIGRLEPVIKDSVAVEDSVVDLYVFEERKLNASLHYVEVDEDQYFVFNHTLLWVSDVDAQEAEIITGTFKTVQQANQKRQYHCLSGTCTCNVCILSHFCAS